jgi:myxalamid-type polyketide synthase MxaE and MxaD
LDGLAHFRRGQGRPALTINWGPWREVGLAAVAGRGDRLAERGLAGLAPAEALQPLARLPAGAPPQLVVMALDPGRWRRSYPASPLTLLHGLGDADRSAGPATTAAPFSPEPATLRALLATQTSGERRRYLEALIRQAAGAVLRLSPGRIDVERPLKEYGLDSLLAVELRNRLEEPAGVRLPAGLLYNYPTIRSLALFLAERAGLALNGESEGQNGQPGPEGNQPLPAGEAAIRHLDDSAVEALLLQELADLRRDESSLPGPLADPDRPLWMGREPG